MKLNISSNAIISENLIVRMITFDAGSTAADVDAISAVEATGMEEFESIDEEGAETVSEGSHVERADEGLCCGNG